MISRTLLFLSLLSLNAFASEVIVKVSLSPAGSFEAKTTKVRGEVKKIGEKLTSTSLWIKIEELKTGIDLRDEHFHKHLNFDKFPKIQVNNIIAEAGKGTGDMVVNDVTQKISFNYKNISEKKIEATFIVKALDFKLKEASYLEIGVENEVEIIAKIDL